ncbi:Non-homologous end joining protein Ku [Streptomyces alboniger]
MLLIDSMTADGIEGQEWATDRYTAALEQVIAAKADGKQPPAVAEEEPAGKIVDLMAALQQSVQQAQASRGEGGPGDRSGRDDGNGRDVTVHEMPTKRGAKKQTTKKAAAKKSTSKRTTAAKKTTAKKRGA